MKKLKELEPKIYECLGVKQFQKLVFLLEKVIHFKDKGKNINYHIKNYSIDELEQFKKFLYFNGFIHVRNSVVLVLFLIIQILFLNPIILVYIVPSLIKNIYCVMLQRYNYIRIDKAITHKKKKIEKKTSHKVEKLVESEKFENVKIINKEVSLEQLQKLKKFLEGTSDAYLDESSLEMLTLLKELIGVDEKDNLIDKEKTGAYVKKKEEENI